MRAFEVGVIPEPLQNLNEDQISDREKFLAEQPVEFVRLRRHRAIEVVDPDARINQNQIVSSHRVKIALPAQFAAEFSNFRLFAQANQHTQTTLNGLFFRARATDAQGLSHQLVIDYDIGPRGCVCPM